MDYNPFADDNGRTYANALIKCRSTIMQIMSIAWVKSTLMIMEIFDSIVSSSNVVFG